jgi:hypothetical protein
VFDFFMEGLIENFLNPKKMLLLLMTKTVKLFIPQNFVSL